MHRPQAHPSYQRMYSSSMTWNGWKELRVHIYLKDMLIRVLVTCKCNVLDCKCIAFFMLYCIAANMWLLKTVKIICSLCVVQKCFVLWTKVSKRWAHQSRGPFDSVNDATAISQRECHGNGFLSWACGIAKTSLFSISDFGRSSDIP